MKKLLSLVIAMAILLSACEDKEQPLPTPQPYINKFNCKINGKYWEVIPKGISELNGQGNTLFAEFQFKDSILNISTIHRQLDERLAIRVPFYLNRDTFVNAFTVMYSKGGTNNICYDIYKIDKKQPNYFIISERDTKNLILKGKFLFTAVSNKCNDTIKVTEGYFDYNFK